MQLLPSTWEELLKSDDIEAYEEDIFIAMMIYVQKFNLPETYEVLERLLPWVRLPLMNDRFLEEQVSSILVAFFKNIYLPFQRWLRISCFKPCQLHMNCFMKHTATNYTDRREHLLTAVNLVNQPCAGPR